MSTSALGILPDQYQSNALHSGDRAWLETNCYVDLWIEVVHALGLEPRAALPFTLALDFEGDQWLFYKQPTSDLYDLYGIDVQELAIWRPLLAHCSEQVARGRIVLVEVDAFHLPDTRGVSYGTEHAKTTIGIERIDRDREQLGYFHNAGYYTLRGADFAALFGARKRDELAPYTEFAKFDRLQRLPESELVTRSLALLRRHLLRAPRENPFTRFALRFPADVAALSADTPQAFHQYAFTTLRQCGSCCELAGSYLRWLEQHGQAGLTPIAEHFERLASAAKGMQFGAARAVLKKRPFSPEASLAEMAGDWARAMEQLQVRYAS